VGESLLLPQPFSPEEVKKLWHNFWMDWHEEGAFYNYASPTWEHHFARYNYHRSKLKDL
jgi:hypothetical protein